MSEVTELLLEALGVRLADCAPLKIVVPGPDNIRRRNLETYFQTHGVEVDAMMEMDAMIGTLEFVARSDWVTVLPSLISVNDIATGDIVVGIAELTSMLLLLIPRFASYGASLFAVVMLGAIFTHYTHNETNRLPFNLFLLALSLIITFTRRPNFLEFRKYENDS